MIDVHTNGQIKKIHPERIEAIVSGLDGPGACAVHTTTEAFPVKEEAAALISRAGIDLVELVPEPRPGGGPHAPTTFVNLALGPGVSELAEHRGLPTERTRVVVSFAHDGGRNREWFSEESLADFEARTA